MESNARINHEWLTRRTGDPFADVGGVVLKTLMRVKGTDDVLKLIEHAANIYVNDWGGKLHAFFLNSTITQAAFVGNRKIQETKKFFKALWDETLPYEEGYCRIVGVKTKLFSGGRDNHILSGSGTFINFHHAFQGGVMLSKEALIRMFFVPLGCSQLGDKIAMLASNNEELMEYFIADNVLENSRRAGTKIADGIRRLEFKSPSSALFDFALRWIREAEKSSDVENTEITLYHFTNFGASPEIAIHNFSSALFFFYARVQHRTLKPDWDRFSYSYFRQKGAQYQYETNTFELIEKKETNTLRYEDFKSWYNSIYENLLIDSSILRPILSWVGTKKRPLNFEIVKLYQTKLRDMNEKTLQIIERIADYVLDDSGNIKKNLRNLQKATKAHIFRAALLRLEEKNLAEKKPNPLFSLEEYALELFPDGTYWQEIQTLLLIAIYQRMHEQEIWIDGEDLIIEEPEEETIDS
ncbi:MAG: type I-B CRISPR-associated protein Cas8b1/Cst1 [Saprospiraceae bacterium]|nr:type I-B CRISPR-associated protein Cas8b1/Cst1 [Saprospiraceae bacterium]